MNTINSLKKNLIRFFSNSEKKVQYEFHKWKKQLLIADKFIYVFVVICMGIFRPDIVLIISYVLLYPYLILTQRKSQLYHLLTSSIIALIFMILINDQYSYNKEVLTIFGINSFPLFGWACGLFAAYLIYLHWEHKFKFVSLFKKMLLFTGLYWVMLVSIETIAYHILDIKNLSTAIYPWNLRLYPCSFLDANVIFFNGTYIFLYL